MHRVVALVRSIQSSFELSCAVEFFGTSQPHVPQRYEFEMCTETPGPVRTSAGYEIDVTRGLDALDSADTVIIPGWLPVDDPLPPRVGDALRRAHAHGARIVTICTGAFALARTGLLDDRSATTHEANADRLRHEFPQIDVVDALYIDHGDVATSAGAGAGMDLCLHLVERDFGTEYAALVARSMVIPHRVRTPAHPVNSTNTHPLDLAGLTEWVDGRLQQRLSVTDLAAHLNISPRTLARRCAEDLGTGPGEWILSRRIAEAQRLLEDTQLTVDAVAIRVGLGSAVNLRRRFRAHVGATPTAYRRSVRRA